MPAVEENGGGSKAENSPRILFRDAEDFERKRQRIVAGGVDHLQIISGTAAQENGRGVVSCVLQQY